MRREASAVGIRDPLVTSRPVGSNLAPTEGIGDFETWYRHEHPRLVGALFWVGGDPDAVREAVDEACARALERWERVGQMESPAGWVYTVALNAWRRARRRAALEQRLLLRSPRPAAVVPGPAGEAWDLVRELPLRERTAVALRYVADFTEARIAEVMGVRRSTVSVLLRRAHVRLAERLQDPEPAVEG